MAVPAPFSPTMNELPFTTRVELVMERLPASNRTRLLLVTIKVLTVIVPAATVRVPAEPAFCAIVTVPALKVPLETVSKPTPNWPMTTEDWTDGPEFVAINCPPVTETTPVTLAPDARVSAGATLSPSPHRIVPPAAVSVPDASWPTSSDLHRTVPLDTAICPRVVEAITRVWVTTNCPVISVTPLLVEPAKKLSEKVAVPPLIRNVQF